MAKIFPMTGVFDKIAQKFAKLARAHVFAEFNASYPSIFIKILIVASF